ncbi:unnamed protein product [Amoebophrya sp. A25]|nr:unnamed protein product [Amoebophrya sp. A25]|eukprot:GSA25T00012865001.1
MSSLSHDHLRETIQLVAPSQQSGVAFGSDEDNAASTTLLVGAIFTALFFLPYVVIGVHQHFYGYTATTHQLNRGRSCTDSRIHDEAARAEVGVPLNLNLNQALWGHFDDFAEQLDRQVQQSYFGQRLPHQAHHFYADHSEGATGQQFVLQPRRPSAESESAVTESTTTTEVEMNSPSGNEHKHTRRNATDADDDASSSCKDVCVACLSDDVKPTILFLPCAHLALCQHCVGKCPRAGVNGSLHRCPICRSEGRVMKIFRV